LHGVYLVVHQLWQAAIDRHRGAVPNTSRSFTVALGRMCATALTFLSVVVAWVFFRATSLQSAVHVLGGMWLFDGITLPLELRAYWPSSWLSPGAGVRFAALDAFGGLRQWGWIAALLVLAWFFPNSQELVARWRSRHPAVLSDSYAWTCLGALLATTFLLAAINGSRGSSEFIYFNF
jgi:hypothetical protein